jgi:hypothetical protein
VVQRPSILTVVQCQSILTVIQCPSILAVIQCRCILTVENGRPILLRLNINVFNLSIQKLSLSVGFINVCNINYLCLQIVKFRMPPPHPRKNTSLFSHWLGTPWADNKKLLRKHLSIPRMFTQKNLASRGVEILYPIN